MVPVRRDAFTSASCGVEECERRASVRRCQIFGVATRRSKRGRSGNLTTFEASRAESVQVPAGPE